MHDLASTYETSTICRRRRSAGPRHQQVEMFSVFFSMLLLLLPSYNENEKKRTRRMRLSRASASRCRYWTKSSRSSSLGLLTRQSQVTPLMAPYYVYLLSHEYFFFQNDLIWDVHLFVSFVLDSWLKNNENWHGGELHEKHFQLDPRWSPYFNVIYIPRLFRIGWYQHLTILASSIRRYIIKTR
jgi:hypothetical protein